MTTLAVTAPTTTDDIRDIKGLVPVPQDLRWLWVLLAIVVVAVVGWLLWRRMKQPTTIQKPSPMPLSSYETALQALRRLWDEKPEVELFYTRLSDIVRRYLEGHFQLRAPERTTEEFLYEVSRDHALSEEHQRLLSEFLQESDLVKFAKFRPEQTDMKRAFDAAEKFVHDTGPQPREETMVTQS